MPPQPLSRIKPNVGFSLTADGFDQRPKVAEGIAQCIAYWAWVETQLSRIFVVLIGSNEQTAVALYNSFESASAKLNAIRVAALSKMQKEDLEILEALIGIVKSKQKIRDKIAHWMWGLPTELPDAMILVDPKSLLKQNAQILEQIRNGKMLSVADVRLDDTSVYVYRPHDLTKDAEDFAAIAALVNKCLALFSRVKDNPSESASLRAELTKDVRLAPFLSQTP